MKNKEVKYQMNLYPWQKSVANFICDKPRNGKVCILKSPRQRGKSYCCEGILLWYAINQKSSINAMISPTLAQSRKIFKEIVNAIYSSGIIKRKNETLLEIELINGSSIFFKSAEIRDGLRGYHINGILILDEAAFLTSDILELVLPWINVANAPLLLVSTPKTKNGPFYSYWCQGFGDNPNIKSIDWCDFDTSEMISQEMIEQYKKVMTSNQFKSEILGEFLDEDGMVFSNINQCINSEGYDSSKNYNGFFVGIDFGSGGGGDYTSLTVFSDDSDMVYLDYFNDLTTFQQVDRIISDLSIFGNRIKKIYMENNSIGSPFIDLILKTASERQLYWLSNTTERWTTTNTSKGKLVSEFTIGLEQSEIKLLDDKNLINQLSSFEATYNLKTQVITYNGAYGTNDDCVMSSMLAWYALSEYKQNGNYKLSFGNKPNKKLQYYNYAKYH